MTIIEVAIMSIAVLWGLGTGWMLGHVKGYKAGLDYGEKLLEDYHQHTMKNIKNLREEVLRLGAAPDRVASPNPGPRKDPPR